MPVEARMVGASRTKKSCNRAEKLFRMPFLPHAYWLNRDLTKRVRATYPTASPSWGRRIAQALDAVAPMWSFVSSHRCEEKGVKVERCLRLKSAVAQVGPSTLLVNRA